LPKGLADAETWREKLVAQSIERRINGILLDTMPKLREAPIVELPNLINSLTDVHQPSAGATTWVDAGASSRLERYLSRAQAATEGKAVGIPTGLMSLDKAGFTHRPGELTAFLGPMNVGKSSFLMHTCSYAYVKAGARILFLSPESPTEEVEARLDPMLARQMGFTLSYTALRKGQQDPKELERYLMALEGKARKDFIIIDSGENGEFKLDDVIGLARTHRPDILAIDGFHLLNTGSKTTWESFVRAAKRLKGLAQGMGMAVVTVSQVQRNAVVASNDTANLGESAYGLALEETADKIIHLAEVRGDKFKRIYKLNKNRVGERIDRRYVRFDVDGGDIHETEPRVDSDTGSVEF